MKNPNRSVLGVVLAFLLLVASATAAENPVRITVSVPGPRNISYLPVDLVVKIGADRAEGALIELLHTGGGGVALNHLLSRNADFAVAGLPAAMSQRVNGGEVAAVAPVDDAPLFVFMVRSGLRDEVRRFADLKGKIIGVNASSLTSKTTSQQLAELLLRSDGVSPDVVRLVPAGQSWLEQSSLLENQGVDAIMGDEPFASRLLAAGKVFFLANLADPAIAARIPGANFLHAVVLTREEMLLSHPEVVERMVRIIKRSLAWIASHTPEEIVAAMELTDDAEQESLVYSLKTYSRLYSTDGRFSTAQLRETEVFFRTTSGDSQKVKDFKLEDMIVDKWAARKP